MTSNIIYWIPFFKVSDDLRLTNEIFFQKSIPIRPWRLHVIQLSHFLPMAFALLELLMNKIRIPWHHIFYNMFFTGLFMLASYVTQILNDDIGAYLHRLNFDCDSEHSYLKSINVTNSGGIDEHQISKNENNTCTARSHYDNKSYECYGLYNFTCDPNSTTDLPVFNDWYNRDGLLCFIFLCNAVCYIIFCLVHFFKARKAVGYNADAEIAWINAK